MMRPSCGELDFELAGGPQINAAAKGKRLLGADERLQSRKRMLLFLQTASPMLRTPVITLTDTALSHMGAILHAPVHAGRTSLGQGDLPGNTNYGRQR
uniref:Uncharacterized protein n=1 Tax=Knipowitschia caucasica TaxID=637954 RepID=A0AAV2J9M6_KNICA